MINFYLAIIELSLLATTAEALTRNLPNVAFFDEVNDFWQKFSVEGYSPLQAIGGARELHVDGLPFHMEL